MRSPEEIANEFVPGGIAKAETFQELAQSVFPRKINNYDWELVTFTPQFNSLSVVSQFDVVEGRLYAITAYGRSSKDGLIMMIGINADGYDDILLVGTTLNENQIWANTWILPISRTGTLQLKVDDVVNFNSEIKIVLI